MTKDYRRLYYQKNRERILRNSRKRREVKGICKGRGCNSNSGFQEGFIMSEKHKKKIGIALEGRVPWNKGKSMSEGTKEKQRQIGLEKIANGTHPNYKGENIGYRTLHIWVNRRLGKATICESCGKAGKGREIHWANKDHKYKRKLTDFISLCVSCHKKYDRIMMGNKI